MVSPIITSVFQVGVFVYAYNQQRKDSGQANHGTPQKGKKPRLVAEIAKNIQNRINGHQFRVCAVAYADARRHPGFFYKENKKKKT